MPAPTVTISRAQGQPQSSPGVDFALCIIGTSSATPLSAGALSSAYYSPSAVVADYGIGDGVDAVCHALTKTTDNPAPPGVSFLSTHGMSGVTAGVRGATLDVSHVTGGTTVSKTASTHPEGTFQPYVKVLDDGNSGAGTAIGTAGIILQASLDGGRTFLPSVALGTATTFKVQIPNPGGSAIDTGVQYDFTHASGSDKLVTGDYWTESKTTPPQWAGSDLYTAGTVPTGALSTIAQSAQSFGLIAITEPVAAADIATLTAALNACQALRASFRPTVIVRFRDQGVSESDATYLAALATFRAAAASDARICAVAGDGWLTDAFRGYVYSRSGLPAVLARLQGMAAIPGSQGERVAQSPGYAARGPLVGFSVRDTAGNPVGHDERVRGGALGPYNGKGGFLCFYYEASEGLQGTYIAGAPTLYDVLPTVQTLMDNRVSSGIERVLYSTAFTFLQGADVITDGQLDDDIRDAMAAAAMQAIRANYANEIANAQDPNLVTVDSAVQVSGPNVTVTWHVNDKLYSYTNAIVVTIANAR